jgi:CheY-like chemotaxis protein
MPQLSAKILCVDDDPGMREFLVYKLQDFGFHPIAVSSGCDALRIAESEPIALVILDYEMPEMNGEQLAAELRRRVPRTPLVLISGNGVISEQALKLVDRFVPKDNSFARKLVAEISHLMDGRAPVA